MFRRIALEALSVYLRWCPLERGRWRLLKMALPLSHSRFSEAEWRTVYTRSGFRLCVNKADWIGRHIYISGEFEPSTTRVFEALLETGDTAVDIGANIGYFTLLSQQRVGSRGKVIAFEPMASTRQQLLKNIRLNGAVNVDVRGEAVCEATGLLRFYEGPLDHNGISSLRPLKNASRVRIVKGERLDDLMPRHQNVKLIKIDIEGAELAALRGMRSLLTRCKPDLIIEVTDSFLVAMGHSAGELRTFLADLGYRMYAIEHDGLLPVKREEPDPTPQYNALFTVRSSLPKQLTVKSRCPVKA